MYEERGLVISPRVRGDVKLFRKIFPLISSILPIKSYLDFLLQPKTKKYSYHDGNMEMKEERRNRGLKNNPTTPGMEFIILQKKVSLNQEQ